MKTFLENKKHFFAIFKQGYHIGNQPGFTINCAIKDYLLLAGYSKNNIIESNLINKYVAIKAVPDIHYSVSEHIELSLEDAIYRNNELKRINSMEDKYSLLINLLKKKKENYADLYNEYILKEVKCYKNKAIPCLSSLSNSFEIKEWLISLKCHLLQDKNNLEVIIKDSVFYGTKPLIY